MGIFSRFKDIVSANISSMLDTAEDPEKLIRLMLREMEETLVELKASCASSMAEATQIRKAKEAVARDVALWKNRAELALKANREDMAREAVDEALQAEERLNGLATELNGFDELIATCREDIRVLEDRIVNTRDKQRLLTERHSQAQVRRQAREKVRNADSVNSMQRFEELEQRIQRMEYEADLAYTPPPSNNFASLEREAAIKAELDRLRNRLNPIAQAQTQALASDTAPHTQNVADSDY